MTYYEEDNPDIESTENEGLRVDTEVKRLKKQADEFFNRRDTQHEELMEMLGGIFVQLSRVYDTLMFVVTPEHQKVLDDMHSRGELFGSPPTLVKEAWGDETIQDND